MGTGKQRTSLAVRGRAELVIDPVALVVPEDPVVRVELVELAA
jgi:hypothetical protein